MEVDYAKAFSKNLSVLRRYEIYKLFVENEDVDLSKSAQQEMYIWESQGKGNLKYSGIFVDNRKPNGYALGKKWAEITVNMWKEDIRQGLLFVHELYAEGRYPRWWLDESLKRRV